MALLKCSLCVCALLVAGMVGVEANVVAKQSRPNGVQPFSIGVSVTPISKVIDMIAKIKEEVEKEAADEETIFQNFACFCKDKTERLEHMVHHHSSKIDLSSSNIADWTAQTNELNDEMKKRMKNHETFSSQLEDYKQRLKQETISWENILRNYNDNKLLITQALKALTSLTSAKNEVNSGAFLQVPGDNKLKEALEMGETMGFITAPKHKALAASLLQLAERGSPDHDRESYEFHEGSDDIIDLITSMKGQMKTLQESEKEDHFKAEASYKDMILVLDRKIGENQLEVQDIKHSHSTKRKEIAETRTVLIENHEDLKESQGVLKQITAACTSRAEEYDARTAMRTKELAALSTAMACLTNSHSLAKSQEEAHKKHKAQLEEFNKLGQEEGLQKQTWELAGNDALLQVTTKSNAAFKPEQTQSNSLRKPKGIEVQDKALEKDGIVVKARVPVKVATKPLSFLQELFGQSRKASFLTRGELSLDDRKKKALGVLLLEGKRAKSLMLTSLATNSGGDPFAKVKKLITDLRWRLEEEEHGEVDKHVWCTESVEKAEHERDSRFDEAQFLSTQVNRLEASIESLKASIKYHSNKAKVIGESLVQIYTDVAQLSAQQTKAMNVQKEARDEMQTAITVLRSFYSQAADKSLKEFIQVAGPDANTTRDYRAERRQIHNENAQRAEDESKREGSRQARARTRIGDLKGDVPAMGRQGSLGDAIALMQTIVSDFTREIGNLEGNLDAEHQQLVKTNQILLTQKEHAEELRDLDMRDLESAKVSKSTKLNDMQTSMDLLDLALKELEGLKPTCIDSGMSYSERVKMRESEMKALVKALCILGETDVKFGCPSEE